MISQSSSWRINCDCYESKTQMWHIQYVFLDQHSKIEGKYKLQMLTFDKLKPADFAIFA